MRRLLTSFIVLATMLTYCLDASAWTDVKLHGNFYGSWADIAGSGSNNNWSFTIDGTKMTDGRTYEFGLRCENGTEFYASSVTFNFSSSATQSQTIAKANSTTLHTHHIALEYHLPASNGLSASLEAQAAVAAATMPTIW